MGFNVAARGAVSAPVARRTGALLCVLAAVGVVGVLSGTPTHDRTVRTIGDTVLVRDTFTGRDNPSRLGHAPGGSAWQAVSGTWGTEHGSAYVSAPVSTANLAVIETPGTHEEISVTLRHAENNVGVVFRYRDPSNYWAVLASPEYAIWYVVKVVDGKQLNVAKTALIGDFNPSRITVRLAGAAVEVWAYWGAEITPPTTFVDPDLAQETRAGLIATGEGASGARLANFVVTR